MAYSGRYTPKNPQKYHGDVTNIVYRSLLERRVMVFFDNDPRIVKWSSEEPEFIIPYICATDGKQHRYFIDFVIQFRSKKDAHIKTIAIEVKPEKQTVPPKQSKRKTKRYLMEVLTWAKNESKWKYASEYCRQRDWHFEIWTEKTIDNICGKVKKKR